MKVVVLQADPASVGSQSGGTINLTAAVFDADNKPIDGIDVLFVTSLGRVNPLVDRTSATGSQGGISTSVLQIAIGALENEYVINALAGGVTGSTRINVVPGRVAPGTINPGVPPGEPASITLGSSPTRIQVAGTGGTELSSVIGRVFDNNGNPIIGVPVRYHVVAAQSAPGAVVLPVTKPAASGTPTPSPATQCAPDDPVAVSDIAGFAVVQVRAGSQPGPVTVEACTDTTVYGVASPLIERQTVVTVTSGPVNRIGLSINPRFIDNNDGSLLATATAFVTDAQGNTVEDGTPVYFEIVTRRVCSGGSQDAELCAVDADCPNGACVPDVDDSSRNVVLSSNTSTNGLPPCDVSQFVVQTGIPVSVQPGLAITCVKFPELQQGSEVAVRAKVGDVYSAITPLTLPGRLGDLFATVNPATVSVSDTAPGLAVVRVTALNDQGDGVDNVRVRLSTSVGLIDRNVLTDANGEGQATLTIPAGTAAGTASVRVTAGGLKITDLPVTIVQTSSATPTAGPSAQPAGLQFLTAVPDEIGVRGSGLQEQSTLTYMVTDSVGQPASGVLVRFSIARVGDESLSPSEARTDSTGKVQVTLTSGRRAISVQVTAEVSGPPTLVTRSTAVNILGGPPSQPNFSLAHHLANISGRVTFGLTDELTAFAADRFGNPVPPGTAVNFTTRGGAVGNLTPTDALGQATATLVSQQPIADNGIVSSLATTSGERPFTDVNGNGVCDAGDQLGVISEPYYDANCNGAFDTGEDFVDLNNNGLFDPDQGPARRVVPIRSSYSRTSVRRSPGPPVSCCCRSARGPSKLVARVTSWSS